jgi:hypothetical protein
VPITVAERWNGSSWSIQRSLSAGSLNGVSCTSPTRCTAVGSADGRALVERWNGSRWAVQSTPRNAYSTHLDGVACPSPTLCIAVGSKTTGGGGGEGPSINVLPLVEQWNGATWSIRPSAAPVYSGSLASVSCISVTACTVVGTTYEPEAGNFPLAERWDGTTWSFANPAVSAGPYGNCSGCTRANYGFAGVSCATASSCTAVGSNANAPLAERWDGTAWTIQPTLGSSGSFDGVSCASPVVCTAVGSTPWNRPQAEAWDGTNWTIQPTPGTSGSLDSVSCMSSMSECIAVGTSGGKALAERWGGTSWALLPTAAPTECVVPYVRGKSLAAARKLIRAAHCAIGEMRVAHRPEHTPGKHQIWKLIVSRQSPGENTVTPSGSSVKLTLVYKTAHQ